MLSKFAVGIIYGRSKNQMRELPNLSTLLCGPAVTFVLQDRHRIFATHGAQTPIFESVDPESNAGAPGPKMTDKRHLQLVYKFQPLHTLPIWLKSH